MELFRTEDVDPVKEVKQFHREVSEKDLGGFTVKEVELGSGGDGTEKESGSRVPDQPTEGPGSEMARDQKQPASQPEFDLGGLPMMEGFEENDQVKTMPVSRNVPEEVLMNPWAGFDEWKDGKPPEKKEELLEVRLDQVSEDEPWKGSALAPVMYSEKDALSLAGEEHEFDLKRSNQPFLLLRATYSMVPEDGQEPVELEGTYLYDTVRFAVHDLPEPLYKEMEGSRVRWDGKDGPAKLPDLKGEHNNAVMALRDKVQKEKMAKDRKVRETQMSTIFREIKYRFDPSSLRLHSSKRVMVPFWVKTIANGKVEWEVNAYLGQLVKNK
jgi:hypothetical protein